MESQRAVPGRGAAVAVAPNTSETWGDLRSFREALGRSLAPPFGFPLPQVLFGLTSCFIAAIQSLCEPWLRIPGGNYHLHTRVLHPRRQCYAQQTIINENHTIPRSCSDLLRIAVSRAFGRTRRLHVSALLGLRGMRITGLLSRNLN